jgi:mono/diheme cytochrome c family protein
LPVRAVLAFLVTGHLLAASAVAEPASAGAEEQAAYLTHCAACHLANGQGVPSAFPPFDARIGRWAATDAGRDYLASVVGNGLFGPIEVNGVQYMGAMPQMKHIDAAEIAGALNYAVGVFGGTNDVPFTADELVSRRDRLGSTQSRTLRPTD